MRTRLELHEVLCGLANSRNVYFQPPENVKMSYPCIVYSRISNFTENADNIDYLKYRGYTITVIDKNPDSIIAERVESLQFCEFERSFTADGLNHFVYTLYY